jgi:MFS family permease
LIIGILAGSGLVVSLTQTLVIPLLPIFPGELHSSAADVSWLVTASLVAGAVGAPMFGRLGDLYGKRRALLVALGLMTVGSVIGAALPTFGVLLLARVLQGLSLGAIALGISLMRDELPPQRVGYGVALMSATLGIGAAAGLPFCGFVADQVSWRWLFAGMAVLGAVLLAAVGRYVAESPLRAEGRFDLPGAVGLGAALVGLLLVISKGEQWGWSSPTVLGVTGASLLVLAWWGWYELRRPAPLVNLRVSARPAVLLTNLATVLMGYSMFTMFVVTPQILQAPPVTGYGFGSSVLLSGLLLLPIGLAMTIFSPVSARLSQRRGARTTLLVGSLIAAVGNILFAFLHAELSAVVTLVTVTAIGSALAYSALPLLIMSAVPTVETAAANSLNMLMRMFGTAACSAIVVAVTAGITVVTATGRYPSATAYTVTFLLAAAAALGSAALTLFLPGRSRDATPRAGVWRARLVSRFGAHTDPALSRIGR